MIIGASNTHAAILAADETERAWIGEFLSFRTKSYAGGRYYESETSLLSSTDKFPAGFLPLLQREAEAAGVTIEMREAPIRANVPAFDSAVDLGWLSRHPFRRGETIAHQTEALQAVVDKKRGILWVPTGGGKTEIAAGLCKAIHTTWLFVVHRSQLATQARERFILRGVPEEDITIAAEGSLDFGGRIVCATFQSLVAACKRNDAKAIEFLRTVRGLIVDEAHTLPADTFYQTVMRTTGAVYRVGLSGTPLARSDKRSLFAVAALGPVIYRIRADTLIAAGILSRPRVVMLRHTHEAEERMWRNIYPRHIANNDERNALLIDAALTVKKPALLFVGHVDHGRRLCAELMRRGVQAEFMFGQKSVKVRQAAVRRLRHGDTDVIVCSVVFQEGVDIPEVQAVIIGTGGKSAIAAIQRIGRGTRVAGNKSTVTIVDIHDEPCEGMEGLELDQHAGCRILAKHTRERVKAYRTENYEVTIGDLATLSGLDSQAGQQ